MIFISFSKIIIISFYIKYIYLEKEFSIVQFTLLRGAFFMRKNDLIIFLSTGYFYSSEKVSYLFIHSFCSARVYSLKKIHENKKIPNPLHNILSDFSD